MSGWAAKRFWADAGVAAAEGGWAILLDGRPAKTPARVPLIVPTRAMADHVAAEWRAQQGKVDPRTMPWTRSANAALDKVAPRFSGVAGMLAAYGETDLLCYRAEGPAGLVQRQNQAWNPLLAWAAQALDAPLNVTSGVMPLTQPAHSLNRLAARVAAMTPFQLTGLHDLVAISGSLILALAVAENRLPVEAAWNLSRLDEHWQAELWGRDAEADALEAARHDGIVHAERFYRLCS